MSLGLPNESTCCGSCLPKLSMSITSGAMALTRPSDAPVSHEVQPRFDAPDTTNDFNSVFHSCFANACSASMARTRLLAIGNKSGQLSSSVFRYWTNVSAIRLSSFLPLKSGWFGMPYRKATGILPRLLNSKARNDLSGSGRPPSFHRNMVSPGFTPSGTYTTIRCSHLMPCQVWLVISIVYMVPEAAATLSLSVHLNESSGFLTYSNRSARAVQAARNNSDARAMERRMATAGKG